MSPQGMYTLCIFTFHYVSIKTTRIEKIMIFVAHLHSTMYLLKLFGRIHFFKTSDIFTFHYVSIKTTNSKPLAQIDFYLHSTMYLLKPHYLLSLQSHFRNLHSTMYLLKQCSYSKIRICEKHLHSTMYLLKPRVRAYGFYYTYRFTFHYVSIKTTTLEPTFTAYPNLHSTMYLLKQINRHK